MVVLVNDFKYLYKDSGKKTKRYHLFCDQCGTSRGYGMKSRSHLLCKVCTHKGKDYLYGKRNSEYRRNMSIAKQGQEAWNKDRVGIFSNEAIEKIRNARIKRNPNGDLVGVEQYRIKRRCLVYLARQVKRYSISGTTSKYCSNLFDFDFHDFIQLFESKFAEGMTWDNHGEWHIDHIIPDSAFKYKSVRDPDFKESWSLENLQPLWAKDNMKKGNKYKG